MDSGPTSPEVGPFQRPVRRTGRGRCEGARPLLPAQLCLPGRSSCMVQAKGTLPQPPFTIPPSPLCPRAISLVPTLPGTSHHKRLAQRRDARCRGPRPTAGALCAPAVPQHCSPGRPQRHRSCRRLGLQACTRPQHCAQHLGLWT